MDTIYASVAGLDVHKQTIAVCIRRTNKQGRVTEQVRTFGTMTKDLLALSDWLHANSVTHVAMESTGVFWKPVFNILEGQFELLLVNPRDVKQVPGRKSDVSDCQWIAHLLACGLLTGSFVPPEGQRQLRDLTRQRAQLVGETNRVVNRIHKTLEDANIKLGAVATDILGKSGRDMLRALIAGQRDPDRLARLARRRLKAKIPQLTLALEGRFTDHHRFMLQMLMEHLEHLEHQIEQFDRRVEELLRPFLTEEQFRRLDAIPGINRRTIENVIAETGSDMSRFPTDDHIASWGGLCPGNDESAGKRKRRRAKHGNPWLRRALVDAAWAASRTKASYLSALYRRLAARRGKKRALLAVGHTLLRIIYHMLKHNVEYADLGADYFDTINRRRLERYLVKRLQGLGYEVTLTPQQAAA
ncbi:MAG: IS110 family transposase [Planctomycetes bacterium]|nr:IS110 family transposase [Planctomycetota bacterium]